MYRIAKAMLRDETNIEDAIQTTILKAYENIKTKKKSFSNLVNSNFNE